MCIGQEEIVTHSHLSSSLSFFDSIYWYCSLALFLSDAVTPSPPTFSAKLADSLYFQQSTWRLLARSCPPRQTSQWNSSCARLPGLCPFTSGSSAHSLCRISSQPRDVRCPDSHANQFDSASWRCFQMTALKCYRRLARSPARPCSSFGWLCEIALGRPCPKSAASHPCRPHWSASPYSQSLHHLLTHRKEDLPIVAIWSWQTWFSVKRSNRLVLPTAVSPTIISLIR